jgi:hypothetical protein
MLQSRTKHFITKRMVHPAIGAASAQHSTLLLGQSVRICPEIFKTWPSRCHWLSVGRCLSCSHTWMSATGTPSNSANSLCKMCFSNRLALIWSPSVFGVVGNAFHGLRFAGMWLRDVCILRCAKPNSCIPEGEGESNSTSR